MKDYFRLEKIKYCHRPYLLLGRLLIDAGIIILNYRYACVIIALCGFLSIGYKYISEEERILPMSEKEIISRRMLHVFMIWLRFAILGTINILKIKLLPDAVAQDEWITKKPILVILLFILSLTLLFRILIGIAYINKPEYKSPSFYIRLIFLYWLPLSILLEYAFAMNPDFNDINTAWIASANIIILMTMILLSAASSFIVLIERKMRDYYPITLPKMSKTE